VINGENNTVWATEQQIIELFGKARRTIGEYIKYIYDESELGGNTARFKKMGTRKSQKPSNESTKIRTIHCLAPNSISKKITLNPSSGFKPKYYGLG